VNRVLVTDLILPRAYAYAARLLRRSARPARPAALHVGEREPGLRRLTTEILGRQSLSIVYRRDALLAKPLQTVMRFLTEILRSHAKVMRG
jgi:hypothetical protein